MKKFKYIYYSISLIYSTGVTIWSATIYLFMHKIGYTYSEINLFLSIFWFVTFFSEIPSGYIADHLGYLKTIQVSGLTRAVGLLILALSPRNLVFMIFSAIFTALGDSLQSGTMSSWIANKAATENERKQLGSIYSLYGIVSTPISMVIGFIGAHFLANIDLKLPLIAGAVLLIVTAIIVFPLLKFDSRNLYKFRGSLIQQIKVNIIPDVKAVIKNELNTFRLILIFFPILIISAGPLDQWQLYFQHGKKIETGTIYVAMSVAGMLGAYIYKYIDKHKFKQLRLVILCAFLMALTIIFSVLAVNSYHISILLFLLNTIFGSIEQILQETILQQSITMESNRATIISVSNALDAGVSVIVLSINGYISDNFGIGSAWIFLATLGIVLFGISYLLNRKAVKVNGA